MRDVRISDTTMKEAARSKALTLSFKEKLEIAKLLERLGVSVVEIEGIEKAKADSLRIKSIASLVKTSVLAVPVKLDDPANAESVWNAVKEAAHPRLQIQASLSPAQMEYTYRKKAAGMMDSIAAAVAECAKHCPEVEFIAEDATRSDIAFLSDVITRAIEAGARYITLEDEAGKMLPDEFSAFVSQVKKSTPALEKASLGISCSNALYMADACVMAALAAGVDEVKACSYPLGIASTNKLVEILAAKADVTQVRCGVRTTELKRVNSQIAWICEAGRTEDSRFANLSDSDDSIVLTAHDDAEAVMQCVARLGYDLSAEDAASVYEEFVRIAAKKDVIGSRELDAIVASAALQVPATFILKDLVFSSGNTIRATACVHMEKDGQLLEGVGVGDGPIDASFMAIESIAGRHFELDDFQIQSVTEGQEAAGETVVKLVSEGKIYSGRGISTDIVGSSIRAYINALNKIFFEEQN